VVLERALGTQAPLEGQKQQGKEVVFQSVFHQIFPNTLYIKAPPPSLSMSTVTTHPKHISSPHWPRYTTRAPALNYGVTRSWVPLPEENK
jgi:hypothetical protein